MNFGGSRTNEQSLLKFVGRQQEKPRLRHGVDRYSGVNLYVKNLDDRVDDEYLEELFSPFGTIISAKVMLDSNQHSKGYGFVCFSSVEEASNAVMHRNGHTVFSHSIHVSLARLKNDNKKSHYHVENQWRSSTQQLDDEEILPSQCLFSMDDVHVNSKKKNQENYICIPRMQSMDGGHGDAVATGDVTLSSRLASLLNKKTFSDVQFSVGGEIFYAHKLVLALSSEVFASWFYGELALTELLKPIVFTDVTPRGFSYMLQFLYTDEVQFANAQDAKETFKASQKFGIHNLQTVCQDYLFGSSEITPDNVCCVFENADISTASDTLDKCQEIFQTETKNVLESSDFLSSSLTTVEAILKNDVLNVDSELDLIEAVVAWGREECKQKNIPHRGESLRACVGPLLKHLRFLSLPTEVFLDVVKETELLTTPEACLITLRLSQPDYSGNLPPGICDKTKKRVPPSSKPSCCQLRFPLIETQRQISTGFSDDIISTIQITMLEGQIKIFGFILEIKRLQFKADILEVSVDVNSSFCEYSMQEKVQVSADPITVMLKKALLIPAEKSASLSITIEDLQINRCYTCLKSDFSICKGDTKSKVHLSGNKNNENGGLVMPVESLLYENC